jgi:hypothetical protein
MDLPEHGYVVEDARPGVVFTDGLEVLRLEGNASATIDAVEPDGEGFATMGVLLAGPERTDGLVERFHTFPPRARSLGPLRSAVGATLQPTETLAPPGDYELLIGTRVTTDKVALRDGIWLRYHVGDREYAEHLRARIVFCPVGGHWRACASAVGIDLG